MKSARFLLSVLILGILWAPRAYSATVAVMPVQGVNLSEGECDAIGVLFANAFSRDANVAVASPLETKSIRRQARTSLEAATRMAVALYIELTAMQLGTTVKLQGVLFGKDGNEMYRAGTVAPSLDDMETETAKLARALILRQPVPMTPRPLPDATVEGPTAPEVPAAPPAPVDPKATVKALGGKSAFMQPRSSGRTFSPMVSAQFDGRIGPRGYFFEFGAGAAIPLNDSYGATDLRISTLFFEIGGSVYLSEGNTALYVGGGVSPGIWISRTDYNSSSSGTLAAYGQLGLTLTRDSRAKFYGEIRVSQYLLGVVDPTGESYGSSSGTTGTYHPTLVAFQVGVGW
ncbi:MAG TPA: hypothetical protein VF550_22415 [Polyangia bacterium]